MQRDSHPPRWLAVVVLAVGIAACERPASRHPERDLEAHDDQPPTEAAKA